MESEVCTLTETETETKAVTLTQTKTKADRDRDESSDSDTETCQDGLNNVYTDMSLARSFTRLHRSSLLRAAKGAVYAAELATRGHTHTHTQGQGRTEGDSGGEQDMVDVADEAMEHGIADAADQKGLRRSEGKKYREGPKTQHLFHDNIQQDLRFSRDLRDLQDTRQAPTQPQAQAHTQTQTDFTTHGVSYSQVQSTDLVDVAKAAMGPEWKGRWTQAQAQAKRPVSSVSAPLDEITRGVSALRAALSRSLFPYLRCVEYVPQPSFQHSAPQILHPGPCSKAIRYVCSYRNL